MSEGGGPSSGPASGEEEEQWDGSVEEAEEEEELSEQVVLKQNLFTALAEKEHESALTFVMQCLCPELFRSTILR